MIVKNWCNVVLNSNVLKEVPYDLENKLKHLQTYKNVNIVLVWDACRDEFKPESQVELHPTLHIKVITHQL